MSGEWTRIDLFDPDEFDRAVDQVTEYAIEALRDELASDPDLTLADVTRLIALAEPKVRECNRQRLAKVARRMVN